MISSVAMTFVCLAVCSIGLSLWNDWRKHFARRTSRSSPKSPSYLEHPAVVTRGHQGLEGHQQQEGHQQGEGTNKNSGQEETPRRRSSNSSLWSRRSASLIPTRGLCLRSSSCSSSLSDALEKSPVSPSRSVSHLRNNQECTSCSCCNKGSPSSEDNNRSLFLVHAHAESLDNPGNLLLLGDSLAENLNMDHVYMSFVQFVWVKLLVYPSLVLLAVKGLTILAICRLLQLYLGLEPRKHDPAKTAAKVILETTLVIHYQQFLEADKDNEDNRKLAEFVWDNMAIPTPGGSLCISQRFHVVVDVHAKCIVEAHLDGRSVTAEDCLTLVTWTLLMENHPRMHAMANWGVNLEEQQQHVNQQLAFESAVTVMYNYFGLEGFPNGASIYAWFGALSNPSGFGKNYSDCVEHALQEGIPAHPAIAELMPYSDLVRFVCHVRPFFLSQFTRHKEFCFPGCDGEALFVGTVLHGIDHAVLHTILEDALWFDVNHPRFGGMAEVARIALCAFAEDLPFLPFQKSFRTSRHPFYHAVYQKAVGINAELAGHMDTCIIK